jgi:rubrerythrin
MMEKPASIEAVLDRAIALEEEAAALYTNAAAVSRDPAVCKQLEEMAGQEREHRAKLEGIRAGNIRWAIRRSKSEPAADLRLSDHLEGGSLDPKADYQDVLLFAARREKATYEFYAAMGELVDDPLTKAVFEMLANEEKHHKYRLEKIYEDVIYKDF